MADDPDAEHVTVHGPIPFADAPRWLRDWARELGATDAEANETGRAANRPDRRIAPAGARDARRGRPGAGA